jgi:hypothetical protein
MYGELNLLEHEMTDACGAGRDTRDMVARLERLEERANHHCVTSNAGPYGGA